MQKSGGNDQGTIEAENIWFELKKKQADKAIAAKTKAKTIKTKSEEKVTEQRK